MKIIKRNEKKVSQKWQGRFACYDCDSVLEVKESDLDRYQGRSPRGNPCWDYAVFCCPCCNELNSVTLPKPVLERLTIRGEGPSRSPSQAKPIATRDAQ